MKRFLSLLLAAGLAIGIAIAIILGDRSGETGDTGRATTLVRGVIGSEKQAFFADPAVQKAFARHGLRVETDPAGSRQIATAVILQHYDFAFPSSSPAAEKIQRRVGGTVKYAPFSSPMAVATFRPIADLLGSAGVARDTGDGVWTLDVARYLDLVKRRVRWDQLKGNDIYAVRKSLLISTTDPRNSNSAAMYLSIVGFVANGSRIVQGSAAEDKVLPLLSRLFLDQGYTENSTEGPFEDYLSVGMGKVPLVLVYEAQFVDRAVRRRLRPDMLLMYPRPTVLAKHTLIPLRPTGDRVGRLLTTDPELQRAAARYGYRTADPAMFDRVVADHRVPVANDLIDVVDTPSYDTLERLLNGVEQSYRAPS